MSFLVQAHGALTERRDDGAVAKLDGARYIFRSCSGCGRAEGPEERCHRYADWDETEPSVAQSSLNLRRSSKGSLPIGHLIGSLIHRHLNIRLFGLPE